MKNIKTVRTVCFNLLLIFSGSLLCAVAVKGIIIPKQFLAGGVTGLSLLIHDVLPGLPLGLIYFILNLPLFGIGWLFVGIRKIDPEAFVVVTETLEVMGKRIGNQPHW